MSGTTWQSTAREGRKGKCQIVLDNTRRVCGRNVENCKDLSNFRRLAVTHFESVNARRAFPCFDEPNFKATFSLNMIRNGGQITTSNMNLLHSK